MSSKITKKQDDEIVAMLTDMAGRAKDEVNYPATRFLQMLSENGGLATVQSLLATSKPSEGFTNMVLAGRIDLTMEWAMLEMPWMAFLSPSEVRVAQRRTGRKLV